MLEPGLGNTGVIDTFKAYDTSQVPWAAGARDANSQRVHQPWVRKVDSEDEAYTQFCEVLARKTVVELWKNARQD